MQKTILWTILGAALVCAPACGGEAELGEECAESGVEDGECTDGAICGKSSDAEDALRCLKVCNVKEDCASAEDCNGVEGSSVKGCRLK